MRIWRELRRQRAIWWKRIGEDSFGAPTFSPPITIECRWEDRSKEFLDAKGERQISQAVVYVDRELSLGDYLKEGSVTNDTPADPIVAGAWEVRQTNAIPGIRAKRILYSVYLL